MMFSKSLSQSGHDNSLQLSINTESSRVLTMANMRSSMKYRKPGAGRINEQVSSLQTRVILRLRKDLVPSMAGAHFWKPLSGRRIPFCETYPFWVVPVVHADVAFLRTTHFGLDSLSHVEKQTPPWRPPPPGPPAAPPRFKRRGRSALGLASSAVAGIKFSSCVASKSRQRLYRRNEVRPAKRSEPIPREASRPYIWAIWVCVRVCVCIFGGQFWGGQKDLVGRVRGLRG